MNQFGFQKTEDEVIDRYATLDDDRRAKIDAIDANLSAIDSFNAEKKAIEDERDKLKEQVATMKRERGSEYMRSYLSERAIEKPAIDRILAALSALDLELLGQVSDRDLARIALDDAANKHPEIKGLLEAIDKPKVSFEQHMRERLRVDIRDEQLTPFEKMVKAQGATKYRERLPQKNSDDEKFLQAMQARGILPKNLKKV